MLTSDRFEATPYCGTAPLPGDLWARWNLDPWLVSALVMLAVFAFARAKSGRQHAALTAASGLLVLVFVSPFCALASALFSARVAHHVILIAVVAPLLALAFPCRRIPVAARPMLSLTAITLMHAIVLWMWHVPEPYRFALSSDAGYWLMQLTLLGSAWLLWRAVFAQSTAPGSAVLALLGTVMQMGFLGALLVFAPRAVFSPHFGVTAPFGLTELQDQQLAGLLMWVPAMLPYLGVALAISARWLRPGDPAAT